MSPRSRRSIVGMATAVLLTVPVGSQGVPDTQESLADLLLLDDLTYEQVAVRLYRALEVAAYPPPACVAGQEMFDDVSASNAFCPFIEELARRGITSGCTASEYCPGNPVSRAQMAAFIVRALEVGNRGVATFGATVDPNGTLVQWFNRAGGEPVAVRNATGLYTLAIPGLQCDVITNCVAQVTLLGSHGFANANSAAGNLLVQTADTEGLAANHYFQVVVFEASTDG